MTKTPAKLSWANKTPWHVRQKWQIRENINVNIWTSYKCEGVTILGWKELFQISILIKNVHLNWWKQFIRKLVLYFLHALFWVNPTVKYEVVLISVRSAWLYCWWIFKFPDNILEMNFNFRNKWEGLNLIANLGWITSTAIKEETSIHYNYFTALRTLFPDLHSNNLLNIIQLLTNEELDRMWYRPDNTNIDRGITSYPMPQ